MSIEELERRDASTINTRRVVNRATNILFKDHLDGVVVEQTPPPASSGEMWWFFTGATEFWTVPDNVYELAVSGQGGINLGARAIPNASFGTFMVPVTPGEQLEIRVGGPSGWNGSELTGDIQLGGWPDGGAGNPTVAAGGTAGGGSGSSRIIGSAGTLIVAPGTGGEHLLRFGNVGSGFYNWIETAGGTAWYEDFIGASDSWEYSTARVFTDSLDITGNSWFRVDSQNIGGSGSATMGGTGADPAPATYPDGFPSGGGGGGGGWGCGAGGTCFGHHTEMVDTGDEFAFRHSATYGLTGQPYAHPSAVWVEFPVIEPFASPDEIRFDGVGHLYVRWTEAE